MDVCQCREFTGLLHVTLDKGYCDWTTLTVSKLFKVFLLGFDALLQLSSGQSATVHISLLHSCGADKPFMGLITVMRVL